MATKKKPVIKYTVLRDSSEKRDFGWSWDESDLCNGTIVTSLYTGDYTLQGLEDTFIIERKLSVSELYQNLITKDYKRFKDELIRLRDFKHAYIVCEFDLPTLFGFPWNCPKIPRRARYKMKGGAHLYDRITKLYVDYNFQIIFAGKSAKQVVSSIFSRMVTMYPERLVNGTENN